MTADRLDVEISNRRHPGERVDDEGRVDEAADQEDVGEIRHEQRVRSLGAELPVDQVPVPGGRHISREPLRETGWTWPGLRRFRNKSGLQVVAIRFRSAPVKVYVPDHQTFPVRIRTGSTSANPHLCMDK
ncbi:hypothetical protein F4554_003733 [Actinopolymorpha rutila]|uniref:Uncharacterized protein n=1 Tax=Actinopolymorpha rutila TaxID=446787 RepID=A0A852ZG05_9ACTN|nr:hypothetical protein [Actinopolymorpha rutila]